ncbi:hypothetical protein [Pseudomonas quasicaspiana]|uniref:hypothetical protein n=1 Tax=Pseudomonas quasicaspiana TaxID=2829821 RepID=UPI001E336CDF|nr:hypothetical protein [Pseudomonas quasicaspiana]MCD5971629.1 hypothetical protein [Pseudomonas quasicaspiana]
MAFIKEFRSMAESTDEFAEGVDMGGSRKGSDHRVLIVSLSALTETSLIKHHHNPISGWLCAINDELSVTYVIPRRLIIVIFNGHDNIFWNFSINVTVRPAEAYTRRHCPIARLGFKHGSNKREVKSEPQDNGD